MRNGIPVYQTGRSTTKEERQHPSSLWIVFNNNVRRWRDAITKEINPIVVKELTSSILSCIIDLSNKERETTNDQLTYKPHRNSSQGSRRSNRNRRNPRTHQDGDLGWRYQSTQCPLSDGSGYKATESI